MTQRHATEWFFSSIASCMMALFAMTSTAGIVPAIPYSLLNLSVQGIYDHPVPLKNGTYEGAPYVTGGASRPRVVLLEESYRVADLDGDGPDDAWVLLSENSGGSGERIYLAAVVLADGMARNLGTILIGDRVKILSMDTTGKTLQLDYVAAGPGEPACCPTQMTSTTYEIQSGEMVELSKEEQGNLSIATLNGSRWHLKGFGRNDPAPDDITITAEFDGNRLSGIGGCNRYTATVEGANPYQLSVGSVMATRKTCPRSTMALETTYLHALENTTQFSFLLGDLYWGYQVDGQYSVLVFERLQPD